MRPAPYPGAKAVARAKSHIGRRAFSGMCQAFTVTMFGTGAVGDYDGDGDADAVDGWRKAVARGKVVHASQISDYSKIPAGVALYWSGGSRGYGHAAVSVGGGQMVTTDASAGGVIGQRPIRGWWARSHRFLGYVLVEGNGYTLNPGVGAAGPSPTRTGVLGMTSERVLTRTKPIVVRKGERKVIPLENKYSAGTPSSILVPNASDVHHNSTVGVRITGLKPGERAQIRFVHVDKQGRIIVADDADWQDVIFTKGVAAFATATLIGRCRKGRRLRVQVYAPHRDITITRVKTRSIFGKA